jgi:hypothetical protein
MELGTEFGLKGELNDAFCDYLYPSHVTAASYVVGSP